MAVHICVIQPHISTSKSISWNQINYFRSEVWPGKHHSSLAQYFPIHLPQICNGGCRLAEGCLQQTGGIRIMCSAKENSAAERVPTGSNMKRCSTPWPNSENNFSLTRLLVLHLVSPGPTGCKANLSCAKSKKSTALDSSTLTELQQTASPSDNMSQSKEEIILAEESRTGTERSIYLKSGTTTLQNIQLNCLQEIWYSSGWSVQQRISQKLDKPMHTPT